MTPENFNRREMEQGRLTWDELAVLVEYKDLGKLKADVRTGALSWDQISSATLTFQKKFASLDHDGKAGEETQKYINQVIKANAVTAGDPYRTAATTAPIADENWIPGVSTWKWFDGPAVRQPRNRKEVIEMFGDPGMYAENKGWSKKNIIDFHEKNGNRLPGVPKKWWISCHRVVAPYLYEACRRTLICAPSFVLERLGSHNWRPIRHKIGNPLSMHSWALAFDLNSMINRGIDFDKGKAPQLWTPEFYKYWDKNDPRTLTEDVLAAWSSCGFANGSDWDEDGLSTDQTYLDLMHMEWVARDGQASFV